MKYLYATTVILLTILVAGAIYFVPRRVIISKISCTDQFGKCDDVLEESLGVGVGKNYHESKKSIVGVLGFNTLISDYSVGYKFPDELSVSVLRRKPRFALSNNSELLALVDGNGVVVGYEEETLLPTVVIDGDLSEVGKRIGDKELLALKLVSGINSVGGVSRAELQEERIVVRMRTGLDVIFPLEGDSEVLLGSLVLLMSKIDSDEELKAKISTVDLRFDNPVLR